VTAMKFQMTDIPISDPRIGEIVARCLQKCGGAIDEALVESKDLMAEADWNVLRLGFGHVLGTDMHDMWAVLVKHHPQYASGIPLQGRGAEPND
jgi:hypothetical protein